MIDKIGSLEKLLIAAVQAGSAAIEAGRLSELPYLQWPRTVFVGSEAVRVWIESQPDYRPNQMICDAGGGGIFDSGPAAQALVALAIKFSPAESAAWYVSLLSGKATTGVHVFLVQGISATSEIALSSGVSLVPAALIPWSTMTEEAKLLFSQDHPFGSPGNPFILGTQPHIFAHAAVLERFQFTQQFLPNGSRFAHQKPGSAYQAIEGTTLVGPTSVRPVLNWTQTEDLFFEFVRSGRSFGQPYQELGWLHGTPVAFLHDRSAELVRRYVEVSLTTPRLRVATERLNAALRRLNPGDRAIEIGTALESLLVEDAGELTYRLCLRAARILGTDIASRQEVRRKMKAFYNLRSTAVHTGVPKAGKEFNSVELCDWAQNQLVEILKRFIEAGRIPDWDEIELA